MKKPDIFDMLADIPKKEVDQNAFSLAELCDQSGISRSTMQTRCRDLVKLGKWEQVWKKCGKTTVMAWRKRK